MITKTCAQCGNEFEGRANKLYCSNKCKMAAFYSPHANVQNSSTFNVFRDELSTNESEYPKPEKDVQGMVTIPVSFTMQEKELLEKQAGECETVLPKLIRIRCLMDETDIQEMQELITRQKQQIEELRVKLGFYQEGDAGTVKRITDKPTNGLLVEMNEKQLAFIREKYLESHDFENPNESEGLPNGKMTSNHCDALKAFEKENPGFIISSIEFNMLYRLFLDIEERLAENCGYDEDEFIDNPLIDEFNDMAEKVKR